MCDEEARVRATPKGDKAASGVQLSAAAEWVAGQEVTPPPAPAAVTR